MNYLQWNDHIIEYFFNEENAYKDVFLYVNKEVIEKVGKEVGANLEDFISAIRDGVSGRGGSMVCKDAFNAYDDWRNSSRSLPPYVAYLAFFVLVAATEDNEFAPHAYYPKFWKLLGYSEERGPPAWFDRMYLLWEDLEIWSRKDKDEGFGIFSVRVRGGWRHVGIPSFETLCSTDELALLPKLFNDADLDPLDAPAPEVIISLLHKYGGDIFRPRTIRMLDDPSKEGSMFRSALATLVMEQLENWDGYDIQADTEKALMRQSINAGLRICINIDFFSGNVRSYFRFKPKNTIPDDGLVLIRSKTGKKYYCSGYTNGWSTQLMSGGANQERLNARELDWKSGEYFEGETGDWHTKLRAASTRVFKEGLDGLKDWVEVQRIERDTRYMIASVGQDAEKIESWGPGSMTEFNKMSSEGLPEGWKLYDCRNIKESCNGIGVLTVSSFTRIKLVGGIKSRKRNSYFDFARPSIVIENGIGGEIIKVDNILVDKKDGKAGWVLPDLVEIGKPLRIEVTRGSELIGRKFVRLESFDALPNLDATPFRNSAGEIVTQTSMGPLAIGAFVVGLDFIENFEVQLPFYMSSRIIFIGSVPGQIVDWPLDDISNDWDPVWAIWSLMRQDFSLVVICLELIFEGCNT